MSVTGDSRVGGLPESGRVDARILSGLLDDTTNSYKHFFFLALLDRVVRAITDVDGPLDRPIPLRGLAVDMVLGAWYPHGFCRLSLGKQDQLQHAVDRIDWGPVRGAWIKAGGEEWRRLRERCAAQLDAEALLRYVPFRLIRPFFAAETSGVPDQAINGLVASLADSLFSERRPLYCFTADRTGIILQHDWIDYLERNAAILRGWARFRLAEYLQARNPSVPGIVEKLEAPLRRESLARQAAWWKEALPLLGARARCIYSGDALSVAKLSLDHFLPWSFVAHDRIWNLVPVSPSVNSSKSDRLPARRYLDALVLMQHAGIAALKGSWSDSRWRTEAEPFCEDLGIDDCRTLLDLARLRAAYEATYGPLYGVAERMGFVAGWQR